MLEDDIDRDAVLIGGGDEFLQQDAPNDRVR